MNARRGECGPNSMLKRYRGLFAFVGVLSSVVTLVLVVIHMTVSAKSGFDVWWMAHSKSLMLTNYVVVLWCLAGVMVDRDPFRQLKTFLTHLFLSITAPLVPLLAIWGILILCFRLQAPRELLGFPVQAFIRLPSL